MATTNIHTFHFTEDEAYMLVLASCLGAASMSQDIEAGAAIMALLNLDGAPGPATLFGAIDRMVLSVNALSPGRLPTPVGLAGPDTLAS